MKPHPNLDRFVRVIEEMAREYVVLRRSIITGDATAPVRSNLRFPRAVALPDMENEEDSDSEPDIVDVIEVFQDDASSGLSDDELGILYNTSLDYEEEEKCE
ncbi:hypothetical protein F442_01914 [Phytophthora nicotianae P10297]|uniref:Uncharacterized protein n=3 Tax=Phytophthora nicotianae TaxID=4792 RepID=W2PGE1_PHYN3|nr:hypothetical protein PPTG_19062 [Phytophthora nicotianae INRA-310]ETM01624.1 hypothetical protein L917_01810 [Phytophthora nicotianae]ETM54852.1 hypothetical protein L914_01868 [Phytophthora nicotianae]ETM99079.1 hypothetical protein PPTG_19062 [Phytophthora nicotianae INRA-310]ETP53172.1 hypothetical protein F442_01914 [Phytophthora nicotianae P10297]